MGAGVGSLPIIVGREFGLPVFAVVGPSCTDVWQPVPANIIKPKAALVENVRNEIGMGRSSMVDGDQVGGGFDRGLDPRLRGRVFGVVAGGI